MKGAATRIGFPNATAGRQNGQQKRTISQSAELMEDVACRPSRLRDAVRCPIRGLPVGGSRLNEASDNGGPYTLAFSGALVSGRFVASARPTLCKAGFWPAALIPDKQTWLEGVAAKAEGVPGGLAPKDKVFAQGVMGREGERPRVVLPQ